MLPAVITEKLCAMLSEVPIFSQIALTGSNCVVLFNFRIVRAFLIEEQKIVVKVLKAQAAAKKA